MGRALGGVRRRPDRALTWRRRLAAAGAVSGIAALACGREPPRSVETAVAFGSVAAPAAAAPRRAPVIADTGVGPVAVGTVVTALRARYPGVRDTLLADTAEADPERPWTVQGTPALVVPIADAGGASVVARLDSAGRTVESLHVWDPRLRTAEGLGVGSQIAALRRISGVTVGFGEDPGDEAALEVPGHCGLAFRLSGGEAPDDPASPNVATAAQLRAWPDTVRVTRVDVYGRAACATDAPTPRAAPHVASHVASHSASHAPQHAAHAAQHAASHRAAHAATHAAKRKRATHRPHAKRAKHAAGASRRAGGRRAHRPKRR